MKTLSVRQPFASLIAAGIKNIENRSWYPKYRGDILIASTKSTTSAAVVKDAQHICNELGVAFPRELPASTALCVVRFRAVVQTVPGEVNRFNCDDDTMDELDLTWLNDDSFGWVFDDVRPVRPFHVSGHLGLFETDDTLIVFLPSYHNTLI